MPLLRKPVLLPTAGLDYSRPASLINDRNAFPQNIQVEEDVIVKRYGKSLYGDEVITGGAVNGVAQLETNYGFRYLVRTSKARVENFNTGSGHWIDISHAPLTGGDDDLPSFTQAVENALMIITNGIDAIRKWPGYGNTAVLGGSPPKAKFCSYLSPYLLLAHVDDGSAVNPWKVQWCDTGAPESWVGGNSGSALLADEPSPIKNILKLNEFAAVYKRQSLWLGRKVDTSDIFLFDCIITGIGLESSRAIADGGGTHYFMGLNDFYAFNGARWESIGKPVRDRAFMNINRSKINNCFAYHYEPFKEIWFFIVLKNNTWPTEVWKYNYQTGFWYFDTCDPITSMTLWEAASGQSWDSDSGTWDAAGDRWDDGVSALSKVFLFGAEDGRTYQLDPSTTDDIGVAVDARFSSIDFVADKFEKNKRWLKIDIWVKGNGSLYVDYSIDEGSSFVNIPYTSTQAYITMTGTFTKYELYFDIVADRIRFQFRNNGSGEKFYIKQFYPYFLDKEDSYTGR